MHEYACIVCELCELQSKYNELKIILKERNFSVCGNFLDFVLLIQSESLDNQEPTIVCSRKCIDFVFYKNRIVGLYNDVQFHLYSIMLVNYEF